MLTLVDLRGRAPEPALLAAHLARPVGDEEPLAAVREIIAAVRERGDEAIRELTAKFDGCQLDALRVDPGEPLAALDALDPSVREALEFARDQIDAYHRTQLLADVEHMREGVVIRERTVPVDRAGLYVPGGRAAYPSTVLMTAIPARVAGVPEVALCVPPDADGNVPQTTLAAAALAGVDEVYRVGGAQAIAALAYGTDSIRPVDVIVGPGNVYVSLAKREVSGVVGIESVAGPSELVVVADPSAHPDHVAVDLMAQAEHGPDGAAILVTWDESTAAAVDAALERLVAEAPRRREIEATMRSFGRAVVVDDAEAAMAVSNWVAPEHLQLMTSDPEALVSMVRNAGAVFAGHDAPAPVGDYVAGVNHVLPTGRTARFSSALRVSHFQKHVHVVSLARGALAEIGPRVATLADAEGLDAHAAAIRMRLGVGGQPS
ncbi:MAG TPA: histidinol dehydrogenase [Acidimicrobiia bacterium]|nr:histidinol dehydrogenase [Acidimicrobiia bacterium]